MLRLEVYQVERTLRCECPDHHRDSGHIGDESLPIGCDASAGGMKACDWVRRVSWWDERGSRVCWWDERGSRVSWCHQVSGGCASAGAGGGQLNSTLQMRQHAVKCRCMPLHVVTCCYMLLHAVTYVRAALRLRAALLSYGVTRRCVGSSRGAVTSSTTIMCRYMSLRRFEPRCGYEQHYYHVPLHVAA